MIAGIFSRAVGDDSVPNFDSGFERWADLLIAGAILAPGGWMSFGVED
jgi:hypothetical protein